MRNESAFIPQNLGAVHKGSVKFSAPSNIALVKYWGKLDNQIPANPSISFTLNNCKTITQVDYEVKENKDSFSFDLFFEGQPKESFRPKIEAFFKRVEAYGPFLKELHLTINTENTFPHSSGIASSASGMAALAMCIVEIEKELNPNQEESYYLEKASFLARLGSGSACRSIKESIVCWGENKTVEGSSNLFGVPVTSPIHEVFTNYQDTILLVDKGEKVVSSTVGHGLMNGHPFAQQRFAQAHDNIAKLAEIFAAGDLDGFIALVESEALTLHAMMMTSNPYFILMKPNTLEIINKIWKFRQETKTPICFTLDAGANVHVLYPIKYADVCISFIEKELAGFCQNKQYIADCVGDGAKKL
ncbi:MAG: diphosphomevalonate decarboxylase [Flavobacteriales bacterium]|nr:diphosphomevalonate decarboxylase [Flavobacteriales bacterium]